MLLTRSIWLFVVGTLVLGIDMVSGQDYPSKPVRIVTGNVGGGNDFIARQIAQGISAPLGQPVIIENRSGNQPGETVAKAVPDGYMLLSEGASFWIGPLLQKMLYDPVKDFAPISILVMVPSIVAVHPSVPVKSIKELIALAKARPGELNHASGSIGGAAHLAGEMFKAMAGVNMVRVPYKGTGAAINALLAGEVHIAFENGSSLVSYIKSGRIRALAVTSAEPSMLLPDLPTVATFVPGYESVSMSAAFAPAKTPPAIINRLNQEIVRFLNQSEVKQRFFESGVEVVGSSPEALAAKIRLDMTKISKLIKDIGIKVD